MRVRDRLASRKVRGNDAEDGSRGFERTHAQPNHVREKHFMNSDYIVEAHVVICNISLVVTKCSNNDLVANKHLLAASEENRRSTRAHSEGYRLSLEILGTFVKT